MISIADEETNLSKMVGKLDEKMGRREKGPLKNLAWGPEGLIRPWVSREVDFATS